MKRVLVLLTLAVSPVVGCGQRTKAAPATVVEAPVKVAAHAVQSTSVVDTLLLTGSVRGERTAEVAAATSGRVSKVNVDRGAKVKAGAVLAIVDTTTASLSAREAQMSADLAKLQQDSARRDCERYQTLFDKGAISRAEFDRYTDQCRTTVLSAEVAQTRARSAAQTVSDGIIRAPFAGTVADRFVDVGVFVRPDSKVVMLVGGGELRVEFAVPEPEVAQVVADKSVTFAVAAFPDRLYSAAISHVSSELREATRDLVVEATVRGDLAGLVPGMFAEVELPKGTRELPTIPRGAIVLRDDKAHVFVLVGGHAEERSIETFGRARGDLVPIKKGVVAGDRVVVSPPPELKNGSAVVE